MTDVSDPLGGSFYVESLTNQIEEKVYEIITDIDARGGLVACIESGWIKQQVSASAFKWRKEVEDGTRVMVGVNKYVTEEPDMTKVFQPDPEAARLAMEDLARHKAQRDHAKCVAAINRLREACLAVKDGREIGSVMAALVDAASADATLGEMQQVLFSVFGRNK